MTHGFLTDVEQICGRMRQLVDHWTPESPAHSNKRQAIIGMLQEMIAAEQRCVRRYHHEYELASALHGREMAQSFLDCAREEQNHIERVSRRIEQLGASPVLPNIGSIEAKSLDKDEADAELADLIHEDLLAERCIIDTYRGVAERVAPVDASTARLLYDIANEEEEHVAEEPHP